MSSPPSKVPTGRHLHCLFCGGKFAPEGGSGDTDNASSWKGQFKVKGYYGITWNSKIE